MSAEKNRIYPEARESQPCRSFMSVEEGEREQGASKDSEDNGKAT